MAEQSSELELYKRRCSEQALLLESLTKSNQTLTETVAGLKATIESLNETIRELQGKLGRNSRNSSQPPSNLDSREHLTI